MILCTDLAGRFTKSRSLSDHQPKAQTRVIYFNPATHNCVPVHSRVPVHIDKQKSVPSYGQKNDISTPATWTTPSHDHQQCPHTGNKSSALTRIPTPKMSSHGQYQLRTTPSNGRQQQEILTRTTRTTPSRVRQGKPSLHRQQTEQRSHGGDDDEQNCVLTGTSKRGCVAHFRLQFSIEKISRWRANSQWTTTAQQRGEWTAIGDGRRCCFSVKQP